MSTPEERAEAVNEFMLFIDEIRKRPEVKFAERIPDARIITVLPPIPLYVLVAVLEELRDAKLARAKLEMQAQK